MKKVAPHLNLTPEDLRMLVEASLVTREVELGCDECLDMVATYAETKLRNLPLTAALQLVEEHLALCDECREEFAALAEAVRGLE